MKNKTIRSATFATAGLALLLLAACSKADRNNLSEKTSDAYHDTKATVSQGWSDLKAYTFEKRNDFTMQLKAKQADFEAQMSKLKAEYSEAQASASRKAAMEELKNAEADYKEKFSALGNASADTWASARDNVVAAWDRLQAAYANARAGN